MRTIAERSFDRYFFSDAKSFSQEAKIRDSAPLREHGVTAAEQLKLLPMLYSYTGNTRRWSWRGWRMRRWWPTA